MISGSEYKSEADLSFFNTPVTFRNHLREVSFKTDLSWEAGSSHRLAGGLLASLYDFRFEQEFNLLRLRALLFDQ